MELPQDRALPEAFLIPAQLFWTPQTKSCSLTQLWNIQLGIVQRTSLFHWDWKATIDHFRSSILGLELSNRGLLKTENWLGLKPSKNPTGPWRAVQGNSKRWINFFKFKLLSWRHPHGTTYCSVWREEQSLFPHAKPHRGVTWATTPELALLTRAGMSLSLHPAPDGKWLGYEQKHIRI